MDSMKQGNKGADCNVLQEFFDAKPADGKFNPVTPVSQFNPVTVPSKFNPVKPESQFNPLAPPSRFNPIPSCE